MKKLINISLILLFTMTFFACEKERIMPINFENKGECEETGEFESTTRDAEDDLIVVVSVTDPDEDEDFDGDDTNVTDPDEDEDFDGDEENGK